jgi:ADP-ribose pyrophosphatase YjhB (NUDIX family)
MSIESEHAVAGILVLGSMYFVAKPISSSIDRNQWVFPGGPLTNNKDPRQALAHELKSKLNLSTVIGGQLGIFKNIVGNKSIELDCYFVESFTGELILTSYNACSWLIKDSLRVVDLASPHDLALQALLK